MDNVTQSPIVSSYLPKAQLEIIHTLSNQLAEYLLEANEEDKERASDLILDNILTKLPGGDPHLSINSLAKILILKLKNAEHAESELVEKTFQSEGVVYSSLPLPSNFNIEFNEATFDQLEEKVLKLCQEIETSSNSKHTQLKRTVNTQMAKISELTDLINTTIQKLIASNEQWTQYITQLYSTMVDQQNFLADQKNYGKKTTSSWLLPTSCNFYGEPSIKTPHPTNISDRYCVSNSPSAVAEYNQKNMTSLLKHHKKAYLEILQFVNLTLSHLNYVAGTRMGMIHQSPFETCLKSYVEGLGQDYQFLHDKCLDVYSRLNTMTLELKGLQANLIEFLNSKRESLHQSLLG